MTEKIKKALWGNPDSPLIIGTIEIPCYVLEDGTHVLSGRGMQGALALGGSHGSKLRQFAAYSNLKPFINNELAIALANPIKFIRPGRGGKIATGYEATVLVDICDAVLQTRDAEALRGERQKRIAKQCEILTRAFAKVGIIALIDEVTGYQTIRDKDSLQKILDKYLVKEYAQWAKRFPDEFYEQMFRLKGWQWRGMKINRPSIVGHYTNDLVYNRLAPGVLAELRKRNPPDEKGTRRTKHHQWLTEEIGHPALQKHLAMLIAYERASSNWGMFYRMVQRGLPKCGEDIPLALEEN